MFTLFALKNKPSDNNKIDISPKGIYFSIDLYDVKNHKEVLERLRKTLENTIGKYHFNLHETLITNRITLVCATYKFYLADLNIRKCRNAIQVERYYLIKYYEN
jgi:hypothetical protein